MATIIPPGYGLVAHHLNNSIGTLPGGDSVVTYGVHFAGTDPQEAVETLAAYFGSVVEGVVADDYTLLRTVMKVGPNSTGATYESTNTAVGGRGSSSVPPAVSLLVKKQTGIGGRSQRGRFFVPGCSITEIFVGGRWGDTFVEDAQEVMDTFLTGITTEGLPMVLLHSASSDPTEVTKLSVEQLAATQRRRQR